MRKALWLRVETWMFRKLSLGPQMDRLLWSLKPTVDLVGQKWHLCSKDAVNRIQPGGGCCCSPPSLQILVSGYQFQSSWPASRCSHDSARWWKKCFFSARHRSIYTCTLHSVFFRLLLMLRNYDTKPLSKRGQCTFWFGQAFYMITSARACKERPHVPWHLEALALMSSAVQVLNLLGKCILSILWWKLLCHMSRSETCLAEEQQVHRWWTVTRCGETDHESRSCVQEVYVSGQDQCY